MSSGQLRVAHGAEGISSTMRGGPNFPQKGEELFGGMHSTPRRHPGRIEMAAQCKP
jgi:hypothetical protein